MDSREPIKIDKNVTLPNPRSFQRYPWREMEIGDSFFVPGKNSVNMSGAISQASTSLNSKFTRRVVTENGIKSCRIWRVA